MVLQKYTEGSQAVIFRMIQPGQEQILVNLKNKTVGLKSDKMFAARAYQLIISSHVVITP